MVTSQRQRETLGRYKGEVFTVLGVYTYYNVNRSEFTYDTILIKNVTDINSFPICDHLWLKAPKFVPSDCKIGGIVKVTGRIQGYIRIDHSTDYNLFVFNMRPGRRE